MFDLQMVHVLYFMARPYTVTSFKLYLIFYSNQNIKYINISLYLTLSSTAAKKLYHVARIDFADNVL